MMKRLVIKPGRRYGRVVVPSSKSIAHREIIASLLSGFDVRDEQIRGWSDDLRATQVCLKRMLNGKHEWPCRESGTTLRLLSPIAKVLGLEGEFIKEGRLGKRPMLDFDFGTGSISLPGDISSQFVSGILFAAPLIGWKPGNHDHLVLKLSSPLQSASYVRLTESILKESGIKFSKPDDMTWNIPGQQRYRLWKGRGVVEGDWSQAAFFVCMDHYNIKLDGLNWGSDQGDRAVADLLISQEIDASQIPDAIPALAARMASMTWTTRFTNCKRLKYKECDRLEATCNMITAVGGNARVEGDDTLVVTGTWPKRLRGGEVKTCGDHRIAMAAAVLASYASGPIEIDDASVVSKSYPKFWDDFNSLKVGDPI